MTKDEALKLALEHFETWTHEDSIFAGEFDKEITAIKEALAQPDPWEKFCDSNCVWTDHHPDCKLAEQEPVAMKFKIYKPTVPDPTRQGINNALLPWVYDQDRNSGFDATMWVTPVATLPPQRKPLTDEEIKAMYIEKNWYEMAHAFTWGAAEIVARAIEAAHGIKGEA